jgi:hypothetical protein
VATFDRDRLMSLFPALAWESPTVVRCTQETRGDGRYISATDGSPRFGHVSIVCSPAFVLTVTHEHHWPDHVAPEERSALDEGLLAGLMQGLTSGEYPAWLCAVTTVNVGYMPEQTTRQAVQAAAALAVQDALQRARWKLQTWPPGAAPHGDEPA